MTGPGGIAVDGDCDGTPGGEYVFAFHRLYGDADGDRDVDTADLAAMRNTFGRAAGQPGYLAHLDSDADGDVDTADLIRLRARCGSRLAH